MTNTMSVDRADLALTAFHDQLIAGMATDKALAIAVLQFPEYATLLADAAAYRDSALSTEVAESTEYRRVLDRANERVAVSHRPSPIKALSGLIKSAGLTAQSVAIQLQIGVSVLRKLDQRMIDFSTVPSELLRSLSDIVFEPVERVNEYLSLPPVLAKSSVFRSDGLLAAKSESFQAAMRTSLANNEIDQAAYDHWSGSVSRGESTEGS